MRKISRRQFTGFLGTALASGTIATPAIASARSLNYSGFEPKPLAQLNLAQPKVVIIGGGAGGAFVARNLALVSNNKIDITLIEPANYFYAARPISRHCDGSQKYIAKCEQNCEIFQPDHQCLVRNCGVGIIRDWAAAIDLSQRSVKLASGSMIRYDRLVISPGIDIKYHSLPGYDLDAQTKMPHAWKSGQQIRSVMANAVNMIEGGTFIMVAPPHPCSYPVGPYQRISMLAEYFAEFNKSAKIIVLDTKRHFPNKKRFFNNWQRRYPGMVDWISPKIHGGIQHISAGSMEIRTEIETFKADAACVIPAQMAGAIVKHAGLSDSDWAPVIASSMVSVADPNTYILGDASQAIQTNSFVCGHQSKSVKTANHQAKLAAGAILREFAG